MIFLEEGLIHPTNSTGGRTADTSRRSERPKHLGKLKNEETKGAANTWHQHAPYLIDLDGLHGSPRLVQSEGLEAEGRLQLFGVESAALARVDVEAQPIVEPVGAALEVRVADQVERTWLGETMEYNKAGCICD